MESRGRIIGKDERILENSQEKSMDLQQQLSSFPLLGRQG